MMMRVMKMMILQECLLITQTDEEPERGEILSASFVLCFISAFFESNNNNYTFLFKIIE